MTLHTKIAPKPADPADFDRILPAITRDFSATAARFDKEAVFPFENRERLHADGLLALTAPKALGGGGADLGSALKVVRAVAKGEPATALALVMQYLFHRSISSSRQGWTDALKRRVVSEALSEGALINALRVEPDLGTPARGGLPSTIARRTPEGWSLSGRKIYSTGSTALTWMVVWARTDDPVPRVGGFLVRKDAPGWHIEETWDHLGLRASASHDVIFDNTPIPLDYALDPQPLDAKPVFEPDFAAWASVLTAGLYDAVAEAARDWFVNFARNRTPANLGAPLSSLARYQEAVGRIDALLLSNRALLAAAIAGDASATEAGLVKHLVTENAISIVDVAIALSGNPGLVQSSPLGRHHRDVLCGRIHTPQADVALSAAGRLAFAGTGA